MRYTDSFLKTKKDAGKEAELISHKYLDRAGYIDQIGAGLYTLMPLGYRVRENIQEIIEEELHEIGVEDMIMPVVHPRSVWAETGRYEELGDELWRIENRSEDDFVLAMTHEETVTHAAKRIIQSYKDLPKLVGQIQIKVRDEVRPRGGLLRLREFLMQDAYSFDKTEEGLNETYKDFISAYEKIFGRVGIETVMIESDVGAMGGSGAHEFMLIADSGEDKIVKTDDGRAINAEKIGVTKEDSEKVLQEKADEHFPDSEVEFARGIEVGNIFKLGTKYSKPMGLTYKDENNQDQPVIMGSYGIGLERLMAAVIEASHDENGMIWPKSIAPYSIYLAHLDEDSRETAEDLYEKLQKHGLQVFYDDRNTSVGNKFNDADLLGIPYRLSVSERTLENDEAEIKERTADESEFIDLDQVVDYFKK